jgi:chemotaxis protein methyltransferase CheR
MCRNVLIYFTQPHATAFLARLADAMNPDGYLFVGGAETLWQLTERFEAVQLGACFAYRPRPTGWRRPSTIAATAAPRVRASKSTAPPPPITKAPPAPAPAPIKTPTQISTPRSTAETDVADQHPGVRLLAAGRTEEAIVALRQAVYLNPDDPSAHFHLGMALDGAGESAAARRAYRVALATLDRCGDDALTHVLRGFDRAELRRLLQERSS